MGNTSSSTKSTESRVDHGYLTPHGIYTGSIDWNQHTVANLILERRLAPFYRPLEDYDPTWDDETILANRKGPEPEHEHTANDAGGPNQRHGKGHSAKGHAKDVVKPTEAQIYRDAVECPICFMYYPPNINHSRCCFQAICTECFVQIKRNEPTPTHLESEPACCPYCQQENFGVTYNPPPWRNGLVSDSIRPELLKSASDPSRRKSFSADSPSVVTTDQIRPDWEERLSAVKAAVARRANRRIIMRQVGDRLIPVGVTSSRTQLPEGITTVEDIEELMLMEAMRLSLLDSERTNNNNDDNGNLSIVPSSLLIPLRSSNRRSPTPRSSGSVSTSAPSRPSEDTQRRQGPLLSALTSPLANASRLIAVSTAMPSRNSGDVSPSPQGLSPPAESSRASTDSQRRIDSAPPPTTALAAAISAHSVGSAILRTSNEPVTIGSASASPSESSAEPVTTAPSSPHDDSAVVPHDQDTSTDLNVTPTTHRENRKDVGTMIHVEGGEAALSH